MSAFVVDRATIHALVHAAVSARSYGPLSYYWNGQRYEITAETADETGQVLTDENVRSVRARYAALPDEELPGRVDMDWREPYVLPLYAARTWPIPAPGFVFKQIDCLDYQSCETDDWSATRAFAILTAIRDAYCRRVPGYDPAPWGCDTYPA